ncbi:hypothetical protein, partial [Yersinia pestis]|uniref:hypothetical protein n=1 Tax=Yersinia pestis TaxID=632 RepID=UPI001EE77F8F
RLLTNPDNSILNGEDRQGRRGSSPHKGAHGVFVISLFSRCRHVVINLGTFLLRLPLMGGIISSGG